MTTLLTRTPHDLTELAPQPAPAGRSVAEPVPAPAPAPAPAEAGAAVAPASRRLVLSGTLSRADLPWLSQELDLLVATDALTVEVDLSEVSAMDAHVARQLLRTSWHLGDPRRRLLLLHPRSVVRRVLRFYGAGGLVVR